MKDQHTPRRVGTVYSHAYDPLASEKYDARLRAAAPDMLALLRECIVVIEGEWTEHDLADEITAILAKLDGEDT